METTHGCKIVLPIGYNACDLSYACIRATKLTRGVLLSKRTVCLGSTRSTKRYAPGTIIDIDSVVGALYLSTQSPHRCIPFLHLRSLSDLFIPAVLPMYHVCHPTLMIFHYICVCTEYYSNSTRGNSTSLGDAQLIAAILCQCCPINWRTLIVCITKF